MTETKDVVRAAVISMMPIVIGVGAYGLIFGLLAAQAGFNVLLSGVMGIVVFAGAAQIIAVERLADGAGVGAAILAGLALNLRYLAIMASVETITRAAPRSLRFFVIHFIADENWALTLARRQQGLFADHRFLLTSGLMLMVFWTASSMIGTGLLTAIPDIERYGLGFAFTAVFIAMARALWRGRRDGLPWLVVFALSVGLHHIGVAPTAAILLAAAAGVMTGVLTDHGKTGPPEEQQASPNAESKRVKTESKAES
ncbi:MAG: AzlC family ABC transporter permease [Pseudomonadota bacterium]